jgi:alpha-D-ribose 1-methylphosphonate 5-triphosphate synthase subunit PhnH
MTVPLLPPTVAREQRAFRALLNAMARPGTVATVAHHPHGGRRAVAVALLEALLDHEVTFAVVPEQAEVIETLLRLTGSRLAPPEEANYLLAEGDGIAHALRVATTGTPEYPDQGGMVFATISRVSATAGGAPALVLAGPGIDGRRTVWIDGFTDECRRLFTDKNGDLPLGIDLVLAAPDGRFTCLSRYTRIIGED